MHTRVSGVPLAVCSAMCFVIAGVWIVWRPGDRGSAAHGARYVIPRWFHAHTWLLPAIAAFLAGFNIVTPGTARVIAFCGLITYPTCMATLFLGGR